MPPKKDKEDKEDEEMSRSGRKISFSDLEKSMITFTGDDTYPISTWIQEFEDTASIMEWSKIEKLIYGKRLLGGTGKLFLRSLGSVTDWDVLKRSLMEEFMPKVNSAMVHKQLASRKMKNDETFQQYFLHMKELALRVSLEDESLIEYVIDGIRDSETNKSILYGARDIKEFRAKLESYSQLRKRIDSKNSVRHNNFTTSTHLSTARKPVRKRCYNCGDTEHIAQTCTKGMKCFRCNEFGHKGTDCPTHLKKSLNIHTLKRKMNIPYKKIKMNGIDMMAFIDTGSDVNLIKMSELTQFQKEKLQYEKNTKICLTGIGEKEIDTEGSFVAKLEIDDCFISTIFHIVKDEAIPVNLILGNPILNDININFTSDGITVEKITHLTLLTEEKNPHDDLDIEKTKLLKLAEQKKSEPLEVVSKKTIPEPEPERPMTKKQKREYEEEMARRQRKQMRMDAEKMGRRVPKEEKTSERERKPESVGFGRIPKLSDKNATTTRSETPKTNDKERDRYNSERDRNDKVREEVLKKERAREDVLRKEKAREDVLRREKERVTQDVSAREKERSKLDREKIEKDKLRLDKERLDKLKAERDRIDREMERLNKDREKLDKTKAKLETRSIGRSDKPVDRPKLGSKERDVKKSIDLKSQNTYRIDKNSNEKRSSLPTQGKPVPKVAKEQIVNRSDLRDRASSLKQKSSLGESSPKVNGFGKTDKPTDAGRGPPKRLDDRRQTPNGKTVQNKVSNSFDFDKHVNSLGKNGSKYPPSDVKRKPNANDVRKKQKRRTLDSDSEYDSEMDDFIDDGDENMDYSKHIKEIFGYDKSKYRDMDDGDDPTMESSFARQQREEYISKKYGIMEDLEDMRMEAMEKSKKKKSRRLSDD